MMLHLKKVIKYVVSKEITTKSENKSNPRMLYKAVIDTQLNKFFRDIDWEREFHCKSKDQCYMGFCEVYEKGAGY